MSMKNREVLIVHPSNKDELTVIKAFLEALKIKFEFTKEAEYNPEFVAKIQESREQAKKGKVTRVEKANLKEFLGL